MRKFGLIGYPLSHSFSPAYFAKKFADNNILDCSYSSYPLTDIHQLPQLLLDNPELEGLNITIPYKKQVIPFLHSSSAAVEITGACNCIRIKDRQCFGYNTDVTGIEKSLQPLIQNQHVRALILGSGGASSAVQYALKNLQVDYSIVSRVSGGSEDVLTYTQLNRDVISKHKLIINTTPVGMFPNADECPNIPYKFITNQHLLYDLIYNPAETLFLKRGEKQGAQIKNGLEMLELQAEESWKVWNEGIGI